MSITTPIGRRPLLGGGLGLLASALLPAGRLWARPSFTADPFSLGVASGDPWPDGFVIWTRLAPEPLGEHGGMPPLEVEISWEVAEDESFRRIVRQGTALARPELGHSVHVEIAGLSPQRTYHYRFYIVGGERSRAGRARTTPRAGQSVAQLRLASVGCQHYEHGYFTAFRRLSEEADLDAIFHYGDYIYEGGTSGPMSRGETGMPLEVVRKHVGGELYTLEDYRRRYAQYRTDRDLQAAHAAAAFIMSYDDHEVDNDWAGFHDQAGTPPEIFALRRSAALQAWYENAPVRSTLFPSNGSIRQHRRFAFGDLLNMHVLDTRTNRDDQLCAPGRTQHCRVQDDPSATMLGTEQEAWLEKGLDRKAHWNFLAQQIMCMPYDLRKDPKSNVDDKPVFNTDDWSGYPGARARLKATILDRKLTNVVIGTGNSHRHIAGHLPTDDADWTSPAVAVEFMSSSMSTSGDSDLGWTGEPVVKANNPHMEMMSLLRGYQIYDVTPKQWTTDIKVMDTVAQPGGTIRSLRKFALSPDRAKIEAA